VQGGETGLDGRAIAIARGTPCGRGSATPCAGTFARTGGAEKGSDGNALCDAWRQCAA
jgi:hypothetical protein